MANKYEYYKVKKEEFEPEDVVLLEKSLSGAYIEMMKAKRFGVKRPMRRIVEGFPTLYRDYEINCDHTFVEYIKGYRVLVHAIRLNYVGYQVVGDDFWWLFCRFPRVLKCEETKQEIKDMVEAARLLGYFDLPSWNRKIIS